MNKCPLTGLPCTMPKDFAVTDIQDNKAVTKNLCTDCIKTCVQSEEKLLFKSKDIQAPKGMEELVVKFEEMIKVIEDDIQQREKKKKKSKTCPNCGMTTKSMMKMEKVGCAGCYDFFREELDEVIALVQERKLEHVGKVPKNVKIKEQNFTLKELNEKLTQAIEAEDYEEAAKIKDKISKSQDDA